MLVCASLATARTWTTSGGFPKIDLVAFTYHHALMPLVDKVRLLLLLCRDVAKKKKKLPTQPNCGAHQQNALAMELAIQKVVYNKTWAAGGPDFSKGVFPAEMAFTERAIPTLVDAGLEWVIVSNSHISRSCKGVCAFFFTHTRTHICTQRRSPLTNTHCAQYPFSPAGDNNDPPNAADQVNPAQEHYFAESISRGCTPNNAYPFSYTPHYAEHVDPETGKAARMVVVPAAQAMSWKDGYSQCKKQKGCWVLSLLGCSCVCVPQHQIAPMTCKRSPLATTPSTPSLSC